MPPGIPVRGGDARACSCPSERIDLPTAIARVHDGIGVREPPRRETGSIEVGKYADLVVLDRNLFEHPAQEIATARVLLTYVEGERGLRG